MSGTTPILFLHIPKTAGTTVHQILNNEYRGLPSFSISHPDQISIFEKLSKEERWKIKVLKGHFVFGADAYYSEPTTYFTFLREPIKRSISSFNYLKSNHPRQSTNLAFKSDSFIYTSIIKNPNEIGQWESPKRFHRSGYKNGINYLIIYSNGHPGSQFQEVIEKSIERLNKIYDVKLVRNNENSVTQILDKTTLEIKKYIPCRTWVIEIYEK